LHAHLTTKKTGYGWEKEILKTEGQFKTRTSADWISFKDYGYECVLTEVRNGMNLVAQICRENSSFFKI
jgi:hypothetical protein